MLDVGCAVYTDTLSCYTRSFTTKCTNGRHTLHCDNFRALFYFVNKTIKSYEQPKEIVIKKYKFAFFGPIMFQFLSLVFGTLFN